MPQNSGLLSQMDRLSLQSPLRPLSVFVFYLLQAHSCRGQSQLIGPPQPIVARVGDDIILPCHLKPAVDVVAKTLEWKRPDLASEFVLVWRDGQDFELTKNPSYKDRSSLFIDELKRGNISLKLSRVQLSDQGTYECFIPDLDKQSFVKLVVGESQLIGSPHQIVATVGDDIILPCHLEPAVDVAARTLEWTRPDLNHRSVHVWRDGQDIIHVKDPSYRGRTSLFTDGLKHGNISLKLSKVKPSDEGRYQCGIPDMNTDSFIELVVGSFSSPAISLVGIDKSTSGVLLDCRSEGWYPEPEVLWLDGEGNLLSAGPPETVRGPDDLYTVSSRVTVEKRHSNSFTCRVQQKNTNQTRETHISISNDFFKLQSSSVPVITGLAVSLAVWSIMFILLLLFVVLKWRLNRIKTQRNHLDQTNKSEDQCVTGERERERKQLMTRGTVEMKVLKGNEQKKSKHKRSEQQLQEEQWREEKKRREEERRREEAEKEVETLKEELQIKKIEIETKGAELQQLHEEKKRNEDELQSLKEELEKKNKELERTIINRSSSSSHSLMKDKQQAAEAQMKKISEELKETKRQLKMKDESISQLMRDMKDKQQAADMMLKTNEELKRQLKMKDESISQLMRDMENKQAATDAQMKKTNEEWKKSNEELKEAQRQLKIKDEEISQLKGEFDKQLWNQQQIHDGYLEELTTKNAEIEKQEEKTKREEAEKQVEKLKKEMETKSSSSSQSSNTELPILIEVNQKDNYIRLKNTVPKDQRLGGWRLEMEVNKKIISYTFKSSFKLKSRNTVSMCGPGCFQQHDLRWNDLTSWNSGDNLKFFLISDTNVRHELSSFTH